MKLAIEVGFRHFDGAEMYMMEKESGFAFKNALEKGFISHEQLFIVSKVILYLLYFPYQIV